MSADPPPGRGFPARRPYSSGDAAIDQAIRDLAASAARGEDGDLIAEIITSAVKLARDGADRGDLKIVNTSLKEMRHAFRVFHAYRGVRKVSIFGSARTPPQSAEYQQTRELARQLVALGFMVITGAGPGVMRAGHEGAGPDMSFGVNIRLPFEQGANDIIEGSPRLIHFKYFFTRKLSFVKESNAIVLMPGGFGTMDEGFESLTLVQTGKSSIMPIVFLDVAGGSFWNAWERFVRDNLLARGLISPEDLSLYRITDSVEEACSEITRFYCVFHSARFVRDRIVLRLQQAPTDDLLNELSQEFKDIMDGAVQATSMLPEEANDADTAHLPRVTFRFDRRHYGRLRMLIDRINGVPKLPKTASV